MAIDTGPSKKFKAHIKLNKNKKGGFKKSMTHPNNAPTRKNPNRSVNPMQERVTGDIGFDY